MQRLAALLRTSNDLLATLMQQQPAAQPVTPVGAVDAQAAAPEEGVQAVAEAEAAAAEEETEEPDASPAKKRRVESEEGAVAKAEHGEEEAAAEMVDAPPAVDA
jgi:hypothetical protein